MMGKGGTHINDSFTTSHVNGFVCADEYTSSYEQGLVSVIAPCYNEEENIEPFLKAVSEVEFSPYHHEILIVNDGSQDRSAVILEEIKHQYPFLRVIHFSRNFGQQQALMAGIGAARGEILVTLDIDLQQPPSVIPDMIRCYEQGYQVVHGIPEYHHSATWFKRFTSKAYYKFVQTLGPDQVVYKSNDFRLLSHGVADVVRSLPERSLYLRGVFAWICPLEQRGNTDRSDKNWAATTVTYRHQPRLQGRPKYSIPRMIALAFDGMTAISIRPLRFGLFLGMISIALAAGLAFWALYMHLVAGHTVSGWTSLMIVILFFSSIQFLLLGLMGEYIGKIFLQVRGRPGYIWEDETDQRWKSNISQKSENRNRFQRKRKNKGLQKQSKGIKSSNPMESLHPP